MDKKHFLIAIVLSNTSLFATPQNKSPSPCNSLLPENPIERKQCPAAYNLPASTLVSTQQAGNLFIDVSYIYWLAGEDGLELGRSGDFISGDDPFFDAKTTFLLQPFQYQSGFKIGAGWRKSDWVLSGEYTWIRNSTSQNSSAPTANPDLGTAVWLIAPWFLQEGGDGGSLSGIQIESKWRLGMDIADLSLSHSYDQGRRLTMIPFGGLRAAWIRQRMNITLTEPLGLFSPLPQQPIYSSTGSDSWAIGPRFGTEVHGLLGCGFRIEGDLAFSLLFTEYTKLFHQEDAASTDAFPNGFSVQIQNRSTLRPVVECGLGFGWGSYIYSNRYHIDFSADYDFSYWWNQNMMKEMLNMVWREISANGDLYLHGLTLSGRFDF